MRDEHTTGMTVTADELVSYYTDLEHITSNAHRYYAWWHNFPGPFDDARQRRRLHTLFFTIAAATSVALLLTADTAATHLAIIALAAATTLITGVAAHHAHRSYQRETARTQSANTGTRTLDKLHTLFSSRNRMTRLTREQLTH
jgi:hypothetical protein